MILPVILSGGVGSRLWPLSREAHPKPFIKLQDGQSLIQKTYLRAVRFADVNDIITVTNRDLFFYTKDEFDALSTPVTQHTFLLEPIGRNSAAAIAIAAYHALLQYGRNCILLVMPADHLIEDIAAFSDAVDKAVSLATEDKLVTFGLKPHSPATGFGYIEASGHDVTRFVEKPNQATAKEYVASGNFFWNSGLFCMRVGTFIDELSQFCPEIAKQSSTCIATAKSSVGEGWRQYEISQAHFEQLPDISVDYAIFEKSDNVAIVPCDIGWSDIGSWNDFGALLPRDAHQNHVAGTALLEQTQNCIIHGDKKLIATLGIDNLIVADTADALLVAHRDRTQDVRDLVSTLKQSNSAIGREFPTVHRPWGMYTVLQEGVGFKLKRIEIKPGARLSLQSHQHRSEHWVVVSGVAHVTNGQTVIELQHDESTYIPAGNKHRLANRGEAPLIIIEVQCGHYLGEDDIIRYEDTYNRVTVAG